MMQILSKPAPAFDASSAAFWGAASDLGEVLTYLAAGIRPDAETVSRLGVSLRALRGFLVEEARRQGWRETISDDAILRMAVREAMQPVTLPCRSAVVRPAVQVEE